MTTAGDGVAGGQGGGWRCDVVAGGVDSSEDVDDDVGEDDDGGWLRWRRGGAWPAGLWAEEVTDAV